MVLLFFLSQQWYILLFWNYVTIKSYKEESEKSLLFVLFVYLFILLQSDIFKNLPMLFPHLKYLNGFHWAQEKFQFLKCFVGLPMIQPHPFPLLPPSTLCTPSFPGLATLALLSNLMLFSLPGTPLCLLFFLSHSYLTFQPSA